MLYSASHNFPKLSFIVGRPYECRCKTVSIVISYRVSLYHIDGRSIVGTMCAYWSMFTFIYRLWTIQESKVLHFVDFLGKKVSPVVQSTDCIQLLATKKTWLQSHGGELRVNKKVAMFSTC